MKRTKPPFRADHVGSFLRPAALKEARAKREQGEISARAARGRSRIARSRRSSGSRRRSGFKLATDGEFRRSWWHFDFYGMLDGVELYRAEQGIQFQGVQTKAKSVRVVGKVGFSDHPMLEHFRFLKAHTNVTPKMTIPAPTTLHFRLGRQSISSDGLSRSRRAFSTISARPTEGGARLL